MNGKQLEQANRVMSGIDIASLPRVRVSVYARQWKCSGGACELYNY